MQGHIGKWGNSLGIRIPIAIAKQLLLHLGTPVTIEVENDKLVIKLSKYDLDIMLKNITKENQHSQILDDNRRGNEEW